MLRSSVVPALFAAALVAGSPLQAQQDTALVEAIIRIDVEHGPSEVIPAVAADSRLLLPLLRMLEFFEVGVGELSPGRYVATTLQPTDVAIRFDTDSMRLTVGDSTMRLGRWDAVWRDGELYVFTGLLADAFGVAVGVDWEALIAVVGRTEGLPVARRGRRERRQALALRRRPSLAPPLQAQVTDRVADGAVFEWSLTGATEDPLENGSAQFGLGAKLLGGGLELRHESHRFAGGSFSETRASWMRAWPEREWLRQIRLGDVQTGGRRSRLIRGVVATNQPFIRSSEFDFEEIIGDLPTGWEIELYDAYGLLDFGEADPTGQFRVAVPLRYGQNPFDMVLYGPQGEVVRRRRTIRVPFNRLPDRQLEYAVGVGSCEADDCGAAFTADVRYGVSQRVTAQAGWDLFTRESESALWQPYVAASAAVIPSVNVTGEAVYNGLLRGQAEFEPTPDLRARVAQTFFDADGARLLGAAQDRRRTEASVQWLTRGRTATAVQVSATRASGRGLSRTLLRSMMTVRRGGARTTLDLRHVRSDIGATAALVQTLIDLNGDIVLWRGPAWLRTTTVGGGVGVDPADGLFSLRALAGRTVFDAVRVDVGVGWFKQGGVAVELGFSTAFGGPRFGSRNRFGGDAGAEGIQFFDGSILWDRENGHVQFGDGRDLGRAGLAGRVFLDVDADGVRDRDEPGIEGVPVRVGGRLQDTDSEGRFSVWELFPFESSIIAVDTTGFESPFYVLRNPVVEVAPTPNSFRSVDIPVVVGAEVSGGVLIEGRPLGGVRVTLREVTTGWATTLITYADGGFYAMGVPPGEYEVSIPQSTLDRIGARSPPVRFTVPGGAEEKYVDAVVLTVDRVR